VRADRRGDGLSNARPRPPSPSAAPHDHPGDEMDMPSSPSAPPSTRILQMMQASATVLPPKDRTAAERSKRYRRNKKAAAATPARSGVTVSTVDVFALAGRLDPGRARRRICPSPCASFWRSRTCYPLIQRLIYERRHRLNPGAAFYFP
jgi:hypothetical protein